jgi:hypothetical protein
VSIELTGRKEVLLEHLKQFPAIILSTKIGDGEKTYAVDWDIMALISNITYVKSLKRWVSIICSVLRT